MRERVGIKRFRRFIVAVKILVGTGRFELPTPRTPSECSTRLSHVPTGFELSVRTGLTRNSTLAMHALLRWQRREIAYAFAARLTNTSTSQNVPASFLQFFPVCFSRQEFGTANL